jgi:group II intron reverse transcriptase/maturase
VSFDHVSHEWLEKFLKHRIADTRVLRLIQKWMKAGVLEEGERLETEQGTPQGAVVSPLLANVYLHYVFDLWAEVWREKVAAGDMIVVRYADDLVAGFQHRAEAERFLKEFQERLAKFGLEVHPDKTRLIAFGREAWRNRKRAGQGKLETFTFLGFTHYCGENSKGYFQVWRETAGKRMRAKLQQIKQELRARMHEPVEATGKWLKRVVLGYYQYHAVPGNLQQLGRFPLAVGSPMAVYITPSESEVAGDLEGDWPSSGPVDPCAAHLASLPECAVRRSHPREEPYAVAPLVRICAGGGQRWPSLPLQGVLQLRVAQCVISIVESA